MEKQEITVNKLVTCLITLAMGIVTLCGLAAVLFGAVDYDRYYHADTGFSMLDFEAYFIRLSPEVEWLFGIIPLFQLLLSIVTIVLAAVSLFLFRSERTNKTTKALMIACLVFLFLYMVEGFIFIFIRLGEVTEYTTLSYVPFIFGVLLFIAYFLCAKKLPQTVLHRTRAAQGQPAQQPYYGAPVPPQQPAPQPSAAESMEEKVKLLTQYKQLLDSGVLTQEEFDKLKAEALGKN